MIRWTPWGAVAEPCTLQIRVAPDFDGRVPAGAPVPSRPLTVEEIERNLLHFTGRGPRTAPCTGLVLAGVDRPEPLLPLVPRARTLGVEQIVLHLGSAGNGLARSELARAVDVRVARVSHPEQARALTEAAPVDAVVLLDTRSLGVLDELTRALVEARVRRVVFTWPLAGEQVPPATEAAEAVRPALDHLRAAGIPTGVKGIPLCTLAPPPVDRERWEPLVWRSTNRFYVDADHQLDRALLFFPDLVRFAKADSCRWCTALEKCDGVVENWLWQGLAGPLIPLG